MRDQGLKELEASFQPVLAQLQAEQQWDVILNNTPGVVLMAGDRVDITEQLIERLRSVQ